MKKISVLSNVNVDMVCKILSDNFQVLPPQGYGNIFSLMLDNNSPFFHFSPQVVFIIIELSELTAGAFSYDEAIHDIDQWFLSLHACIDLKKQYFISDGMFRTDFLEDADDMITSRIEKYWLEKLVNLVEHNQNIHHFAYVETVNALGKNTFFSDQLWYMGKIPFSAHGCKELAHKIQLQLQVITRVPKKILVLDLDNTLWGGVVGELGSNGILLSDDKKGAIYRDCQRIIKQMQIRGVVLAICSKNNEIDALEVIEKHAHMELRKKDFAIMKINWNTKPRNMQEIAKELNVGLESMVFVDDMPTEREAVKTLLPMVAVPEFPKKLEELPNFYKELYRIYFSKIRRTEEDLNKTRQYHDNAKRKVLEETLDYESFLKSLDIKVERVSGEDDASRLRLEQMLQKTNQFNLTTKRYSREELIEIEENGWLIYLFKAIDKFGDYGIIAALMVDMSGTIPLIDSFVMSCRMMGKQIENYMIDYLENELVEQGYKSLLAQYIPTTKNVPVKELYKNLGYVKIEEKGQLETYKIDLSKRPKRSYYITQK